MLDITRQFMPGNMATEGQTEKLAEECIKFKLLKPLVAEEKIEVKSSLKKAKKKDADKEADKMDAKMAAFMNKKASVPSPEVRHEKGNNFDQDINLPLTIIVGGNHLLEDTTLRLTMGKKYGLVGRNGIGKTCLINAISRSEIEKFPQGLHILQVEQEVEGDSKTVLEHILECDVERSALIAEMKTLVAADQKTMTKEEISKNATRLA